MKKKRIIVLMGSLILLCATVATCVIFLSTGSSAGDETQGQINETADTPNADDIIAPPIEHTTDKPPVEKPMLDVGDMGSESAPSVVDSKIEYETKEVKTNVA